MSNFIFATGVVLYLMFRFPDGPEGGDKTHNRFVLWCVGIFLGGAALMDFAVWATT